VRKLLSVTFFSGLLTLLRMSSGFVIAKAVAIYTGPGGMAMMGQVQSFVTAINGVVTSPAGNGLVRYTAEHYEAGLDKCAPWWNASLRWVMRLLAVVVPLTILASKPLSLWLFGDARYMWLVIVAALCLPLAAANGIVTSVINGQQQYKRYMGLGTVSLVSATIVMLLLIVIARLEGALLAAIVFTATSGAVMILSSFRQPWFQRKYWVGRIDRIALDGIRSYLLMTTSSALCAALTMIVTRNVLIDAVGLESAGYWQAVYKVSEVYLGVITMALATYYLPRLSTVGSGSAMLGEVMLTARIIVPMASVLALAVYLLRDIAISVLFTEAFRPARDLFALQLIADIVKIAAWLLAYGMIARKATVWFIGSEVLFSITLPLLAAFFVKRMGLEGANVAYLLNYILYLLFLLVFSRQYLSEPKAKQ
jgi:PST family polysaccharide transporter